MMYPLKLSGSLLLIFLTGSAITSKALGPRW
jgi:hypothetical protein